MAYPVCATAIIDSGLMEPVSETPPVSDSGKRERSRKREIFVKWSDESTARLCAAVRAFPILYNYDYPGHKDKDMRERTWLTVAKVLNFVTDPNMIGQFAKECERRFKNLRDELIKSSRRNREKPYKHAENLSYIDISQSQSSMAADHIYESNYQADDNGYDYGEQDIDSETLESAAYAAQMNVGSGANDNQGYQDANRTPRMATRAQTHAGGSVKRVLSNAMGAGRNRSGHWSKSSNGQTFFRPQHRSDIMPAFRRIKREREESDIDELDDFSKMLIKRIRRLPEDSWGHVMSRLMDTLSSVEESTKKALVRTAGCQTEENGTEYH